jgi:DNA-binding beta-propeller fold protein YncE
MVGALPSSADDAGPGRKAWISRYDGPRHRNDYGTAIAVSPDGAVVFVSGTSYYGPASSNCSDFATVAYDSVDGSQLWTARYDGTAHWCDSVAGIAVSPDGETLFVTGSARESGTGDDLVTIAYDPADGSELWLAKRDGPFHGNDSSVGLIVDPDGSRVYVAGSVQISECGEDLDPCEHRVAILAYDAATGSPIWTTQEGGLDGNAIATAVTGSLDGGRIYVEAGFEFQTMAFDTADGSLRWASRLEDAYATESIVTSSDGETVFVAGEDSDGSYAVVAYAASDGTALWRVNRGSPFLGRPRLAVTPTGNTVLLTGETSDNFFVWALDGGTGHNVWRSRYDGPGAEDFPTGITISADGARAFVSGGSRRRHSYAYSYATAAFDTTDGSLLWVSRFGSRLGGDHFAGAIAAGPQGDVYVTGESEGPTGWIDVATIKYADP